MTNLLKSEFIGKDITIVSSKNKIEENINGIVLDETFHTFKIYHKTTVKTVFKNNIKFKINNSEAINGIDVQFRPEERIKKVKPNG